MAYKRKIYNADIDGLRAIAVLGVVLYHIDPNLLPGGFVGVDVFFVISGFLITRLISNGISNNTFFFKEFYVRRFRRLAPALFSTVILCLIFGGLFLAPEDLRRLGGSSIATILSVSNFFFLSTTGYFDTETLTKPLLHTWSLSLEEQFYLVWPVSLVILLKIKNKWMAPFIFSAVSLISFGLAVLVSNQHPHTAFYLLPFRIFEFSIGASILGLGGNHKVSGTLAQLMSALGFTLILLSMAFINSNAPFHSSITLLPCLGTAFVIKAGRGALINKILSLKAIVGVGLISYSLYLLHWPIIIFYNYVHLSNSRSWNENLSLLLVSLLLSIVMYLCIERPFRRPEIIKNKILIPISIVTVLILALPSAHMWFNNGWSWRQPVSVGNDRITFDRSNIYRRNNTIGRSSFTDTKKIKILVIGDSHQGDLYNALDLNQKLIPNIEVRSMRLDDSCFYFFADEEIESPSISETEKKSCLKETSEFTTFKKPKNADYVIISTKWQKVGVSNLHYFVKWFQANLDSELIVLGRTIAFDVAPKRVVANFKGNSIQKLEQTLASIRSIETDKINDLLLHETTNLGVQFFKKDHWLCIDKYSRCSIFNESNELLLYDNDHWTTEGALFLGKRIINDDLIKYVLSEK